MRAIDRCRVCASRSLESILHLGDQVLTGVFPARRGQGITRGPLQLVKCTGECGLVQLRHSYDPAEMYGENYGYRSGLNGSMVEHLRRKVERLRKLVTLEPEDIVLDVGANDGTNPAARRSGNAVSGMPILDVDHARSIIGVKRSMASITCSRLTALSGPPPRLKARPATSPMRAQAPR